MVARQLALVRPGPLNPVLPGHLGLCPHRVLLWESLRCLYYLT